MRTQKGISYQLNIYKATKDSVSGKVNYVRKGLFEMNGKVKPFVESVPFGTWPTPPTEPFIK
jgi:hypothetical protein